MEELWRVRGSGADELKICVGIHVLCSAGVPNTSIAIDRSIPKVLRVDRMALKNN